MVNLFGCSSSLLLLTLSIIHTTSCLRSSKAFVTFRRQNGHPPRRRQERPGGGALVLVPLTSLYQLGGGGPTLDQKQKYFSSTSSSSSLSTSYKIVAGLDPEWFERFVVAPLDTDQEDKLLIEGQSVMQIMEQGQTWSREYMKQQQNQQQAEWSSLSLSSLSLSSLSLSLSSKDGSLGRDNDNDTAKMPSLAAPLTVNATTTVQSDRIVVDGKNDISSNLTSIDDNHFESNQQRSPRNVQSTTIPVKNVDQSFTISPIAGRMDPNATLPVDALKDSDHKDNDGPVANTFSANRRKTAALETDPSKDGNRDEDDDPLGIVQGDSVDKITAEWNNGTVERTRNVRDRIALEETKSDKKPNTRPVHKSNLEPAANERTTVKKVSWKAFNKNDDTPLSKKETANEHENLPGPSPRSDQSPTEQSQSIAQAEMRVTLQTPLAPKAGAPITGNDQGIINPDTQVVTNSSKYKGPTTDEESNLACVKDAFQQTETTSVAATQTTGSSAEKDTVKSPSIHHQNKSPPKGSSHTDDWIVLYRGSPKSAWKQIPLEKLVSLGYTESDILDLIPGTLEVLARESIPRPSVGIPSRWKKIKGTPQDLVKIVPLDKAEALFNAHGAEQRISTADDKKTEINKSTKADNNIPKEKTASSTRLERQRKRSQISERTNDVRSDRVGRRPNEQERRRRRKGRKVTMEDGTPKPVYSGRPQSSSIAARRRGDPPSPNSRFWPDIETFRTLLRKEAEFRLRLLGDGWTDTVKQETTWRHNLYSDWLWTLNSGIGDPLVESRSDRHRRMRDQARLEESRDQSLRRTRRKRNDKM